MLNQLNTAVFRAYREYRNGSYSLLNCIAKQAATLGLPQETVIEHFEKLYPGLLHPLIIKEKGKR